MLRINELNVIIEIFYREEIVWNPLKLYLTPIFIFDLSYKFIAYYQKPKGTFINARS